MRVEAPARLFQAGKGLSFPADDGKDCEFEIIFFKRISNQDLVPAHWIKDMGMLAHFTVMDFD